MAYSLQPHSYDASAVQAQVEDSAVVLRRRKHAPHAPKKTGDSHLVPLPARSAIA